MRRLSYVFAALLLLLLILLTISGGRIYEWITPDVEAIRLNRYYNKGDERYIMIPKSALTDDGSVYVIASEQGFSKQLYYVHKKTLNYIELPEADGAFVYVTTKEIASGSMIINPIDSEMHFEDGEKVIIK